MNLYLPSVKLMKNLRVGSKLRRVYSPAQTPWERVLASRHTDARRVAELKKLRSTLDPFALAQSIDRKLESIYALANRRLSPKAANLCGATAVEKPRGGKVQNQTFPPRLEIPQSARDSHFSPATTAAARLHL
jgi:hypothetical protein